MTTLKEMVEQLRSRRDVAVLPMIEALTEIDRRLTDLESDAISRAGRSEGVGEPWPDPPPCPSVWWIHGPLWGQPCVEKGPHTKHRTKHVNGHTGEWTDPIGEIVPRDEPPRFYQGSRVVPSRKPEHDSQYGKGAGDARRSNDGKPGVVLKASDAHGLCYLVSHDQGGQAWWKPDELTAEEDAKPVDLLHLADEAIDACEDAKVRSTFSSWEVAGQKVRAYREARRRS